MDSLSSMLEELNALSRPGKGFKPHKYLLLLSVLRLIRSGTIAGRRVYFDAALKEQFRALLAELGDDDDRDRPHTPFFHLANSSFWRLVPVAGRESDLERATTVGGPGDLSAVVEYAELSEPFLAALQDESSSLDIEAKILGCITAGREARRDAELREATEQGGPSLQRLTFTDTGNGTINPFVGYLNSLQRLDASNDNALAESQSCSPFFPLIQVSHPLTETILTELRDLHGRHVVLTGHAGDGKSTVALEVYKQLAGIPAGQPLPQQLAMREDLPGENITIIKDLSERRKGDDAALVQELQAGDRRFLLVSNTGTLLDLLRAQAGAFGMSDVQLESDVLTAISNESGERELVLGEARFTVFNLARMDNLDLARRIFARMVSPQCWAICDELPCRAECPIRLNVDLITNHRERIFDRIFLAYRRMYEYGTRLTLRQITEHLAYLITSGLEETDIAQMRERQETPLKAEFMFFNRFFGDDGKADHAAALQMRAVREIRGQGFGERPCPVWERKLWLRLRERTFSLGIADCDAEFDLLREHGSGPGDDSQPGLTPDQAREQVRRMLYFLYDFPAEQQPFLLHFLNSPTILRWLDWQQPNARLEMTERNALEQRVYHVLQEHFTGVRLPEGATGHDRRLYVTLSRRRNEIRQSAQVVLAQVDWSNETVLEIARRQNAAGGGRTDLELAGRGRIAGASLVLSLPFLDYVVMRHFGELGEILQPAYVERLERFKAQVQRLARDARSDVMLVRLKTDHTFRRQQYTVRDGGLEVNDVL